MEVRIPVIDPGHEHGPFGVGEDEFGTGRSAGVAQPNA